jgi:hypothetical protein
MDDYSIDSYGQTAQRRTPQKSRGNTSIFWEKQPIIEGKVKVYNEVFCVDGRTPDMKRNLLNSDYTLA